MKLLDIAIKPVEFYTRLRTAKWVNVEYWGSDYSDFREYEVISRRRVRMPDGKGLQWPKTKYKHVKMIDEACIAGAT
ncbi:hypothetical protein LCGC14_0866540 [marine sediment metagenome]|uniref:Uncharacterized protein n=1 Tax=marine sediment metagenome TaxID=412755 RepID=A0A0F9P5T5_9ZZZZ